MCAIHSKRSSCCTKNYFFRMSAFQDKLLELYESRPDFVQPESARNEVVSFVRSGLADLSISRSTFWGVVPWDGDARRLRLVRRAAQLHHRRRLRTGRRGVRAPLAAQHLVGKDILRFHAVIWPAMLMAAGLDVPTGRVRSRLAARRRREDEVEAHRHRAPL